MDGTITRDGNITPVKESSIHQDDRTVTYVLRYITISPPYQDNDEELRKGSQK